jgi:hypothetical protein
MKKASKVVENTGVEPLTSCLPARNLTFTKIEISTYVIDNQLFTIFNFF